MISSASAVAALLVAGRLPAADTAAASRAVAEAVAARWGVEEQAVALAWGRDGAPHEAPASLRLVGAARDGWFTVVCTGTDGATALRRVRAGVRTTRPVAARDLPRGAQLADADIARDTLVRWGPPVVVAGEPEPGWEVARPVAAGAPLGGTAVRPPVVIRAGDPVRVEWRRDGVRIALAGTALTDARRGRALRVKVDGRRDRLAALAVAPGVARLDREVLP